MVNKCLSMILSRRMDVVLLSEAANTLLLEIVAGLTFGLLGVHYILQSLVLHRSEQPEALPEKG